MVKVIEKHITFYEAHDEVLKRIMETQPTIKNYSEAIQLLCMSYDLKIEKDNNMANAKLNAMGKEISILIEIASEFVGLHSKDTGILIGTNSTVYQEAKERVEGKVKANQTKKYSPKIKKSINEPVHARVDPFDPTKFSKRQKAEGEYDG